MELRRATGEDSETILSWRNDKDTRENSFSKEEISLETHNRWFEKKLADPGCKMYILEDHGDRLGSIRIDILDEKGKIGEISYMIAPDKRRHGYGRKILELIEKKARETGIEVLTGLVKADNPASCRCFENCGYTAAYAGDIVSYTKLI